MNQGQEPQLSTTEGVKPYNATSPKGEQIEQMFDSIAPAYDFMNRAMTFGRHVKWRDKALRMLSEGMGKEPDRILDLATGTGDVAFALAEMFPKAEVTGCDLSAGMLDIARKKRGEMPEAMASRLNFGQEDCMRLSYDDSSFEIATIAYGVRNFEHLREGLGEMFRVVCPGGRIMILELSVPTNPLVKIGYKAYTSLLIPIAGKLASGDSRAYTYLPRSIRAMPPRQEMVRMLEETGFVNVRAKTLNLGVVTIYIAEK